MGWQDQYRLIGIDPGRVKTSRFGVVDFADPDLPVAIVKALFESGLPYLELAPEGESQPPEEKPVKGPGSKVSPRKAT